MSSFTDIWKALQLINQLPRKLINENTHLWVFSVTSHVKFKKQEKLHQFVHFLS